MSETTCEYVNVILPLAVPQLYTYKIGNNTVLPGYRVIVELGKRKRYTAIAYKLHNSPPEKFEIKEIISVLDSQPIISEKQLQLWKWISEYYMCSIGEVMKASLPAGLKLESETHLFANPNFDVSTLSENEDLIYKHISNTISAKISKINSQFSEIDTAKHIKSLFRKKAIFVAEEITEKYKPKTKSYIKLNGDINSKEFVEGSLEKLKRSPKQESLFFQFLNLYTQSNNPNFKITVKHLIAKTETTSAAINELIKKEILCAEKNEISRLANVSETSSGISLSQPQTKALDAINKSFKEKDVCLLHGVTASGKTEVYIEYIKSIIAKKEQVLYLLPEIALTTQIITRLQKVFGNKVGVYHSRLYDNERIEMWNRISSPNNDSFDIILGARSAIFLPFKKLGAIIIDEEHETSFKQYDPAPRYNARDTAIVLAKMHNAKTLLGSATPSIETYFNVLQKKYAIVELTERFSNYELPKISIINLAKAYKQKRMNGHFSKDLLEKISENLREKRQVILFQNRRGYSPYVECTSCGTIPHCKNCDVSLTYHKFSDVLRCHYCGYQIKKQPTCIECGENSVETMGFGTEKIETDLREIFPKHNIARMDLDTTRGKDAYANLISKFENREIDILIGTQMITKGLDFDNVGLVGVLNADNLLHMPDFRSFERAYHVMVQVGGRAGRSETPGEVYIQSFDSQHAILNYVQNQDYNNLLNTQLIERQNFSYPPFVRLIKLTIKHREKHIALKAANIIRQRIPNALCSQILGPEFPPIGKIQNNFVLNILLKVNRNYPYQQVRDILHSVIYTALEDDLKRVVVYADVDPY